MCVCVCLAAENSPRLFYAQPITVSIFNAYIDSERLRHCTRKLHRICILSSYIFNQHFWKSFSLIQTSLILNVNHNFSVDDDGVKTVQYTSSSEKLVLKSLATEDEN